MVSRSALISTIAAWVLLTSGDLMARAETVQGALGACKQALDLRLMPIETVEQAVGVASCVGTVDAVTTMLSYGCHSVSIGYQPLYIAAAPPSSGAAVQTFVNWAEANPAMWGESAIDGIIAAIMGSFPCTEVE